jgi:hypothetical protein
LKSCPNAVTRKTTSTFAATICSSVSVQATLRENFVRRGRTAWIRPARGGSKPRRDLRPLLAALGVDVVGAAVLHGDARGDEARRRVRFELRFELVRPAQVVQVQGIPP